jgi:hypothetical protein
MPIPLVDADSGERQTLDGILAWHEGLVEALVEHRAAVVRALRVGAATPNRFVGMTEGDVEAYFDDQRRELDRLTVLNLVASVEASIRIDYFRRVRGRLRDALARAYQEWHSALSGLKQLRPDFDEGGILDVLKQTKVMDNHIIGRFRECLRPRHWVGHGRYWAKPVEVDQLDPIEVYNRAGALLQALPP